MISYISNFHRGRLFSALTRDIREPVIQIISRRRFNQLLDLEDRMLDDIGVTREEVARASRLPLAANAALELRRMSQKRRRQCR